MSENITVRITGERPVYATEGAAAADLVAGETVRLNPGEKHLFSTGVFLDMPDDVCALVQTRSGNAFKRDLVVQNSPGLIDPDYRGEVKVNLKNDGIAGQMVNAGDRIAQLRFTHFVRPVFEAVDKLSETTRGEGGHGSTGN